MAMAQNTTQKYLRYCSEKEFFFTTSKYYDFFSGKNVGYRIDLFGFCHSQKPLIMAVFEVFALVDAILKSH